MSDAIDFLNFEDVMRLHSVVIGSHGGSSGIRSIHLLESAISQPQVTIFGEYAHKDLYEMAAAYCYHLIKNHPFVDGNKRTGLLVAITFLEKNGIVIKASFDELYKFALDIAESKLIKQEIANFFSGCSVKKLSD